MVCTFTREAAETVLARAPQIAAGTIYKLTWRLVREFAPVKLARGRRTVAYQTRTVRNEYDPALDDYVQRAPSAQQRLAADAQCELLHGWNGQGPPPFALTALPYARSLSFLVPMARWLEAGRPGLTADFLYDNVLVDEAQDMSTLELAMAASLVAPGGQMICYGDPGQALYMNMKGGRTATLPPAWTLGGRRETLHGGYRVGEPLASVAARVLRPVWDRPASTFAAPHETRLEHWWPGVEAFAPGSIVMARSRADAQRFIQEWGLKDVALVPSMGADGLTVCTGHAAKGAQADHVYLLPWGRARLALLDEGDQGELRLLYTMLTRARVCAHVHPSLLSRTA